MTTARISNVTMNRVFEMLTSKGVSTTILMRQLQLSRSAISKSLIQLEQDKKAKRKKGRHPTVAFNYTREQPIDLWSKVEELS